MIFRVEDTKVYSTWWKSNLPDTETEFQQWPEVAIQGPLGVFEELQMISCLFVCYLAMDLRFHMATRGGLQGRGQWWDDSGSFNSNSDSSIKLCLWLQFDVGSITIPESRFHLNIQTDIRKHGPILMNEPPNFLSWKDQEPPANDDEGKS